MGLTSQKFTSLQVQGRIGRAHMGICVLLAGLVAAAECGKKWKDLVDLCPWTSPDGYGGYQDGLAREEAFLCKEQLCNPGAPTREAPVCSYVCSNSKLERISSHV